MEKTSGRVMLLGVGALSLVLWLMPELRPLVWPLTIFNTIIHELCHAIVTVLTGGLVDHIIIHGDGNGETFSVGGWILPIASAGYLGTSLIGTLTIYFSRTKEAARIALMLFCVALVIALVLLIRGTAAGYAFGLFWAILLGVGARVLRGDWLILAVRFLGFQLCLASIGALVDLVLLSHAGSAMTDARILQGATLIPAPVWAYLWSGTAFVGMVLGLHRAWKVEDKPLPAGRYRPSFKA